MNRLLSSVAIGLVAWAMGGADVMAQPNGKGGKEGKRPTPVINHHPTPPIVTSWYNHPMPPPMPPPSWHPQHPPQPVQGQHLGNWAPGVATPVNPTNVPTGVPVYPSQTTINISPVIIVVRPPAIVPNGGGSQMILPGGIPQDTPGQTSPVDDQNAVVPNGSGSQIVLPGGIPQYSPGQTSQVDDQNAGSDDSNGGNDAGMSDDDNSGAEDPNQGD